MKPSCELQGKELSCCYKARRMLSPVDTALSTHQTLTIVLFFPPSWLRKCRVATKNSDLGGQTTENLRTLDRVVGRKSERNAVNQTQGSGLPE